MTEKAGWRDYFEAMGSVLGNSARRLRTVLRAPTIEEAFEWAATLATQPLPRGDRTVVFTSVGGWGVLAADACAANGLDLIRLPKDVEAAIDEMVPPRWSRNNPIDLAGGETRETIPAVLDLLAAHDEIDGVVHLGLGIQANQANAFRTGPFFPDHGLERIAGFHETQDARYATAAIEAHAHALERRRSTVSVSTRRSIHADRRRLRQVLGNLIRNAVQHTRDGDSIRLLAEDHGEWVRLTVEDSGQGIPEDEVAHVWDRFYRVDGSRNRASGGMGLGLAIVRQLVRGMGGTVTVSSEVGVGTRFAVDLPIVR